MFEMIHSLAESGSENAMKEIVEDIMSQGRCDVTGEQADMALRYLNILAEKGDHEALLSLGALHYTGFGDKVPQDYAQAMKYYEKAAESSELEDDWALNNLGYCYYYGRGGTVDYIKAYSCFALSAMQGNPNAMYKLGDMYHDGHYVGKDLNASFYWYISARAQESDTDTEYGGFLAASIALRLGRAFLFGEGVEVELVQALFELRTAEALFYDQTLIGDEFSKDQLLITQDLIETAQDELDRRIG